MRTYRRRAVLVVTAGLVAGGLSAVLGGSPALAATVNPAPFAGSRNGATRLPFTISQDVAATVDVGTGNLLVGVRLMTLPGVNSDLELGLAYNSSAVATSMPSTVTGNTGSGWVLSYFDERLVVNTDKSVTYFGPGGLTGVFNPVSGSTTDYTSPKTFKSSLQKISGAKYILTSHVGQQASLFSATGRLLSQTDRNGNVTSYNYGSGAVPKSIITTRGGPWSLASPTATIDYTGNHLSGIAESFGSSTRNVTFAYDTSTGALSTMTDVAGKTTSFGYGTGSSANQLTSITNPLGATTTFAYDTSGRVKSVTLSNTAAGSPGASRTRLLYVSTSQTLVADPMTNQSQTVSSVPNTSYVIDPTTHLATSTTDPDGYVHSATYTGYGDVASATSPAGTSTADHPSDINDGESQTKGTSPGGASTATGFDNTAPGQQYLPSSTTDDTNSQTNYGYDSFGNQNSVTPGVDGATANLTYNSHGQVLTAASPGAAAGVVTSYGYDTAGGTLNLVSTTPVSGAGLGGLAYTYDDFGRLKTATDGRGKTTTYTYNVRDEVTLIDYSDSATPDVSYGYDDAGRLASRTTTTGTTTYTLDDIGNLLAVQNTAGGGAETYRYDKAGALVSKTDAGGQVVYAYSPGHQLQTMTYPKGSATAVLRFGYDAQGRRTDMWLDSPNAANNQWSAHSSAVFDSSGRIVRVVNEQGPATSPTTIVDETACYNTGATSTYTQCPTTGSDRLKVQWVHDNLTGASTVYSYNNQGRLTQGKVVGPSPWTYNYTYDPRGNRLTASGSPSSPFGTSLTFNNANEISSSGYTYDGAGNLTASPNRSRTYDTSKHLVSLTTTDYTNSYSYAGPGQIEQLSTTTNYTSGSTAGQSIATKYVYGTRDRHGLPVLEQINRSGSAATFVGTTFVAHDPQTGDPLMFRAPSGTAFLLGADALGQFGSIASTGEARSYTFDPLGAQPTGWPTSTEGLVSNPFGFNWSVGSRFGERRYDTSTGTWTQQDQFNAPLDPANGNRFVYAAGDPVNVSDPTGRVNLTFGAGIYLNLHGTELIELAVATLGAIGLGDTVVCYLAQGVLAAVCSIFLGQFTLASTIAAVVGFFSNNDIDPNGCYQENVLSPGDGFTSVDGDNCF